MKTKKVKRSMELSPLGDTDKLSLKKQRRCKECGALFAVIPPPNAPRRSGLFKLTYCPKCRFISLICPNCDKPFPRLRSRINYMLKVGGKIENMCCSRQCNTQYRWHTTRVGKVGRKKGTPNSIHTKGTCLI